MLTENKKTTTITPDLQTQIETLKATAEDMRERLEKKTTIDLSNEEIADTWETLCTVSAGCLDVLRLLDDIDTCNQLHIENAIRNQLRTWRLNLDRIKRQEQKARAAGRQRQTIGWYDATQPRQ